VTAVAMTAVARRGDGRGRAVQCSAARNSRRHVSIAMGDAVQTLAPPTAPRDHT